MRIQIKTWGGTGRNTLFNISKIGLVSKSKIRCAKKFDGVHEETLALECLFFSLHRCIVYLGFNYLSIFKKN